jgi:hypothetical protein
MQYNHAYINYFKVLNMKLGIFYDEGIAQNQPKRLG